MKSVPVVLNAWGIRQMKGLISLYTGAERITNTAP